MNPPNHFSRRKFLGTALASSAVASVVTTVRSRAADEAPAVVPLKIGRKIKVGQVGCGSRGSWIADLFKQHGGYEFVAVADYFPERAEKLGASLGVAKAKCFSGLSGYKRVIESGIEAIILETPPYFFPGHAAAAVDAGLHVYMAKPVAVDVPGVLKIGALGKTSTAKKRVFLVDYQIPTDPFHIEIRKRIVEGGLGKVNMIYSSGKYGNDNGFSDPPPGASIENRLVDFIWCNDDALGCGYIGNFDLHIIDAVVWALGRRPVSAHAMGGRFRGDPHGDALDTYVVTYAMDDGVAWSHQSAVGPVNDWLKMSLEASIQGSGASARLSYFQRVYVRGGSMHYPGGQAADMYKGGACQNISDFYQNVLAGNCGNDTAQRSVDSTLTCILGREAARRKTLLTMDELLKENKRLEVDLKGLKA